MGVIVEKRKEKKKKKKKLKKKEKGEKGEIKRVIEEKATRRLV